MGDVVPVDLDCCRTGATPESGSVRLADHLREVSWRRCSQGEFGMRS